MLVLALTFWLSAVPQEPRLELQLADQYLAQGLFDAAITEYKRYIFFNQDSPDSVVGYAHVQMATAYREQGLWDQAVAHLEQSIRAERVPETQDDRRLALAVAQIARRRYEQADFLLIKLEAFGATSSIKSRASFLRGVCNVYAAKWIEAEESFRAFGEHGDAGARALGTRLAAAVASARAHGPKSPVLARRLSTVIPGLGQIYAADWKGGISALVINAATVMLVVSDLSLRQVKNAVFDASNFFARFYGGNRTGAEEAAQRYNDEVCRTLALSILSMLEGE